MTNLLLLVALLPLSAPNGHVEANPVYRELLASGVEVADGGRVRFPKPAMPDGVSAEDGLAAIADLPERHVPVEALLRKSVVAPMVFRFRELETPQCPVPVHGVDVWFVAFGNLEVLADETRLGELAEGRREDTQIRELTAVELRRQGITPAAGAGRPERYVRCVFPLLDRVELSLTSRSYASRTDESLLFATTLDPRFSADEALANFWRPLSRGSDGKPQLGPPEPYRGAASYLKVTRLAEPQGALFVEYHLVFTEPESWFDGANLLRSKLPVLIQSEVREFRRKFVKGPSAR